MDILKETQAKFLSNNNIVETMKARIRVREKQIERLRVKGAKVSVNNWWGDILIRPIMAEIKNKFPEITWDDERLVPMGLGCRVSLFGHIGDETVCRITFLPPNFDDAILSYETGERKNQFAMNSIGHMNGFDNYTKKLESMDEIFEFVRKQAYKEELSE